MKKRVWILFLLPCILVFFAGCSINDFFDVESTMSPPQIFKEEAKIENEISGYLNSDFKFCQLFTGGKYSSILKYSFSSAKYVIVFCQTDSPELESHIILLKYTSDGFVIEDDIVKRNIKFGSAQILDMNSEEFCELIVEGIDLETNSPATFSWHIYSDGIAEINS